MVTDTKLSPRQQDDQQYQEAAESADQYMRYPLKPNHKASNNKWPRPILIVTIIIIVLIIGTGATWLIKHHKSSKPAVASSSSQPAPQSSQSTPTTTKQYVSNGQDLNLRFTYPNNWTVTPVSNNNPKDQTITLNSPSTTVQSADGSSLTAKVTVQIRPGTATISELNANGSLSSQNSVQFAYAKPTANQLQYPYLTFIHFTNGSKASGAFEEVIVTGSQQFTQGEAMTAADLSNLDPIISANFYRCSTTACSGQGDGMLSITNSTWNNTTIFSETQSLFNSLQLN